jgi:hypothetical protein
VYSFVVVTVVVGKATGPFANEAPHVIARAAVPVMSMRNCCPSVGVPDKFVVMLVMSTAKAVIEK